MSSKAERTAAKSKAFLTSLIDENPLAIVVLDPSGRVTLCNRAFEQLFSYPQAEILGRDLDRLISVDQNRDEAKQLTSRTLSGDAVHLATQRRRKDGSLVEVEFHGVPLSVEGELIGAFGLYQDITERILIEQSQRESEERFRRLAEATFEGLVIVDHLEIIDCNEQYALMVGASGSEEVIDRSILDFVDPSDHELVVERIRLSYESPYEHRACRIDGSSFFVEVHGKALPHKGRQVRVIAVRDVTEQKRFDDESRQSQKMEAIGRLAGGIAHDFNNLLTIILGHCSMLARQIPEDSSFQGSLSEIRRASEQAGLMTRRLLAFGRKQSVKPQVVDLNQVLGGMQPMLRRLVRADIDLVINSEPNIGTVRADPGQLQQVILNLAINAGDAMPGGGILTIETRSMDLDDTWTHQELANVAPPWVLMTVTDTGIGMNAGTLDRLFEPFFTTKKKGKGTGLGLSTVYGIVKQSGGTILVDSKPGHGTTFRIFFPCIREEASDLPQPVAESRLPKGSETILVVEDESGVRQLTTEFLELHGYQVLAAEDGAEGLETMKQRGGDVQLILTDVVMPGMSGPDMAAHVALLYPDIKVLFMSGYDDGVLSRESSLSDLVLVPKPFSMRELVTKVREVLDGESGSIDKTTPC